MSRIVLTFLVAICAVALIACDSDAEQVEAAEPTPTATTGRTPEATPTGRSPLPTATPSPTATPEPEPQLELLEYDFVSHQRSFDSNYRVEWYALIANHSDQFAESFEIQVLLFDADGVLMDTSSTYGHLWGQQTAAITGSSTSVPSVANHVEVRLRDPRRWTETQTLAFPVVEDVQVVAGDGVSGRTTSPWNVDVEDLRVYCVYRNADGSLVGTDSSFLSLLPSAVTATVDCGFITSDIRSQIASAEIYLGFTSITSVVE